MPMKNAVKIHEPGGIYHVYNRGVNKEPVFYDEKDYIYFEKLLYRYLCNQKVPSNGYVPKNYKDRIMLFTYCLLPNHIHLVLQQFDASAMQEFMQSLQISYIRYINSKYDRVGHLFQGIYRARMLTSDEDISNVVYYTHCNPIELGYHPLDYSYSGLQHYLGYRKLPFIYDNS